MNYLAHLFLSGKEEACIIGNFIADHIRNKDLPSYSMSIQKGVKQHREIDSFTDNHIAFKTCVSIIREEQGKYAPVAIDIYFDFFLSKNWTKYSKESLKDFTQRIYHVLNKHIKILPLPLQKHLPELIKRNWLMNYGTYEGIQRALQNLEHRTKFSSNLKKGVTTLQKNETVLNKHFCLFFNDIKKHVKNKHVL